MQLKVRQFKKCLGGIRKGCREFIIPWKFTYVILLNFKPTHDTLSQVGDKGKWEKGWGENLVSFRKTHKEESLIPKYYHPSQVLRYKDFYIQPMYENFEFYFLKVFRAFIFTFFKKYKRVYEFGCGTGFNLVALFKMYPKIELHGLDWSESSIELLKEINKTFYKTYWGTRRYINIKPDLFDMFNPKEMDIPDGSAVLTWGSLEQIGDKFEPFLQFLLQKKVFVVNIEPLVELYDPDNPMDAYSIEYMKKRGYLNGYLDRLKQLEKEGKIKIERIQRLHFGNMNYEGWSYVTWRVK